MRDREGGDAQGLLRAGPGVVDDRLSDSLGFLGIRPCAAPVVGGVLHQVELQPHAGDGVIGAGNDEQLVLVELAVGDRDQGLVLGAVVPTQHPMGDTLG